MYINIAHVWSRVGSPLMTGAHASYTWAFLLENLLWPKTVGILLTFVDSTLILIPTEGTHEKLHEFKNSQQEKENGGSI